MEQNVIDVDYLLPAFNKLQFFSFNVLSLSLSLWLTILWQLEFWWRLTALAIWNLYFLRRPSHAHALLRCYTHKHLNSARSLDISLREKLLLSLCGQSWGICSRPEASISLCDLFWPQRTGFLESLEPSYHSHSKDLKRFSRTYFGL